MSPGAALTTRDDVAAHGVGNEDDSSRGHLDPAALAGSCLTPHAANSTWLTHGKGKTEQCTTCSETAGATTASDATLTSRRLIPCESRIHDGKASSRDEKSSSTGDTPRPTRSAVPSSSAFRGKKSRERGKNRARATKDPRETTE